MNQNDKLKEIMSLRSVIDSAWVRIEWLDEALAQAEKKHAEVTAHQEQLIHEVAKWAVLEGIAGADDHLPMSKPVEFVLTMYKLLDEPAELLPNDETVY